MRKITVLAVSGVFVLAASTSAFADSKSVAEFLLKTCLPAMDDLANVEAIARDGNWTRKPLPNFITTNRFQKSHSMWDVVQTIDFPCRFGSGATSFILVAEVGQLQTSSRAASRRAPRGFLFRQERIS